MFPLNANAGGEEGAFQLLAGDNTSDIVGYRNLPHLAPPNDQFGSVTGSARLHNNDVTELTTTGSLERFALALLGNGLADDDSSWIQFEISGVFVSGQQTFIQTRATMTFGGDTGSSTIWRGAIGSQTDLMIAGNLYAVLIT